MLNRCNVLLLQAPCCGKTYVCRLCHNDVELHEIDRHAVVDIICSVCSTKQPVNVHLLLSLLCTLMIVEFKLCF